MSTFSTKKYEVSSIFKALTVLGLFSCCKAPLGVQLASLPQRFFSTRPMPTVPMGVRTPGAPLVQSPQFLEDILFTGRLGECWRILVAVAVLMRLAAYPRPALWSLCVSSHCQLCVTSVCSNGKLEWGQKMARRQDMGASFQSPYVPTGLVSWGVSGNRNHPLMHQVELRGGLCKIHCNSMPLANIWVATLTWSQAPQVCLDFNQLPWAVNEAAKTSSLLCVDTWAYLSVTRPSELHHLVGLALATLTCQRTEFMALQVCNLFTNANLGRNLRSTLRSSTGENTNLHALVRCMSLALPVCRGDKSVLLQRTLCPWKPKCRKQSSKRQQFHQQMPHLCWTWVQCRRPGRWMSFSCTFWCLENFHQAADLINKAKRPILYVGQGHHPSCPTAVADSPLKKVPSIGEAEVQAIVLRSWRN